jgi:hypothetical protein
MNILSILAGNERRMLVFSSEHLTWETWCAAEQKLISWANTHPIDDGFVCYCHDERDVEGEADDLWEVMQFAKSYGYHWLMCDSEATPWPPELGMPVFDHPGADEPPDRGEMRVEATRRSLSLLREARDLYTQAGAGKAVLRRLRPAINSAEGAVRHAEGLRSRLTRGGLRNG